MNQRKSGILLSYFNFGLNAIIMLAYVPMLLHYVSKEQYGIYQMIGSFIGVMAGFDFGLGATVMRFLSREKALHNAQQEQNIIHTASALYLVLTGLLLLLGTGAYFLIDPIYSGSLRPEELLVAKQIYLILLLNFMVNIPNNLFSAIVQANERFVFFQLLVLVFTALVPLLIWGALVWKASVINVVWVQTGGNILFVTGLFLYCKERLQVKMGLKWQDKPLIKQLFSFSFFVFLGNIAGQLYSRLGPLVLGFLVGALAVANYYIAAQLLLAFTMIPTLISSVFLPKLSGDYATTASLQTHNDIFCKTGRLQALVALLILIGFSLVGKQFLILWLGPGNEFCYSLALVLMIGAVLNIIQSVGPSILMAINKYRFFACASLGILAVDVVLAFALINRYQTMGCAVAFMLSVGLCNSIVMNCYYQKIGLGVRKFFQAITPVLVGSALSFGILWWLWQLWPVQGTWSSFIAHGSCVILVYSVLMAIFVLNQFERDIVKEIWQKMRCW